MLEMHNSKALPKYFIILVALAFCAVMELSESCHRRVEYHHYYKKRPPPHHGKGGGGGGYHSKGKGNHGGHHHGYHGGDYHGGDEGYHGGGHGGGGGHDMGYKGEHGGSGHGGSGYGHGGPKYGGGYHTGGGQGHGGGHGHGEGHGYHMGGMGSGGDGYHEGHGDHMGGGGYGEPESYHGRNNDKDNDNDRGQNNKGGNRRDNNHGLGNGMNSDDGGGGGGHGHHMGYRSPGHGHSKGGDKGRRYKYQMYESHQYDNKHHQPSHGHGYPNHQSQGYSHNTPHYMKKGYGKSGPYPYTEYSTPIETSVLVPPELSTYDVEDDSQDSERYPPKGILDAADTADLIRNSYDSKENEIMSHARGNFPNVFSDSDGRGSNVVPNPLTITSSEESKSSLSGLAAASVPVDPSSLNGNFDLNLNYNTPDLPAPFRKPLFDATRKSDGGAGGREGRQKKLSSRYRNGQIRGVRGKGESSETVLKDYLENEPETTGAGTGAAEGDKTLEFSELMNF